MKIILDAKACTITVHFLFIFCEICYVHTKNGPVNWHEYEFFENCSPNGLRSGHIYIQVSQPGRRLWCVEILYFLIILSVIKGVKIFSFEDRTLISFWPVHLLIGIPMKHSSNFQYICKVDFKMWLKYSIWSQYALRFEWQSELNGTYCPKTWFSERSLRFSSFTLSTRCDRSINNMFPLLETHCSIVI